MASKKVSHLTTYKNERKARREFCQANVELVRALGQISALLCECSASSEPVADLAALYEKVSTSLVDIHETMREVCDRLKVGS